VEKFIKTDRYIPMSTNFQTALCTMTVSMEVLRTGQAGFKFQKLSGFLAHPVRFKHMFSRKM